MKYVCHTIKEGETKSTNILGSLSPPSFPLAPILFSSSRLLITKRKTETLVVE